MSFSNYIATLIFSVWHIISIYSTAVPITSTKLFSTSKMFQSPFGINY